MIWYFEQNQVGADQCERLERVSFGDTDRMICLQAGEGSKWYMFDPVSWERKVTQPQATRRVVA